jgi:signal transduction histidine kinase
MELFVRLLRDPATYRRLVYLLTAIPLSLMWFVALVTVWSLSIGLLVTPFGIPVLIAMGFMTRGFAWIEAEIARSLLDVDVHAPAAPLSGRGFWTWFRSLFSGAFWRAQAYLMARWFLGFPVGIAVFSLMAAALGLIVAPAWIPFVHGGTQLGSWHPHTFLQSLALVPVGVVLLPLSVALAHPIGGGFRPLAASLLSVSVSDEVTAPGQRLSARAPVDPRRALQAHAAVDGSILFTLVLIWALTSFGYFWPIWVALPSAAALGFHAWTVVLRERPELVDRFHGSRTLALSSGAGAAIALYLIAVWAITGHGYFWPVWAMLGIALVLGIEVAAALLSSPGRTELTERIENLETSRAGAVDLQESELRRIERDLHDGAQARLVALGMSLGMAEQKIAEDPKRASELLAEARAGAEHALRELRDLARGIHPPVLSDRGLEAALESLARAAPIDVRVSVALAARPEPAVETAAYFVAAEALANAGKHARASQVRIRVTGTGSRLELQVDDDGVGGADPNGTGILGMRRRVEALDGTLSITSPPGGPTTIRAVLPCA